MIRTIFLDVRTNAKTNDIKSIAALGCGKNYKPIKEFSAIVKTENSKNFAAGNKNKFGAVREAKDAVESYFKNLLHDVPAAGHTYIVWDRKVIENFECFVESFGYKLPKHKIIVLKEVMDFICYDSEEDHDIVYYLDKIGFKYNKFDLCRSEYFIDIFSDLYMHVRKKLDEYYGTISATAVISKGSLIFHKDDCGYTDRILTENLSLINPCQVINGFIPCKFCSQDRQWRKNLFGKLDLSINADDAAALQEEVQLKKVKGITVGKARQTLNINDNEFTEENIDKICRHFKFKYELSQSSIKIDTQKASWIIRYEDDKVDTLLHENWDLHPEGNIQPNVTNKLDAKISGYHDQKVGLKKLVDVCEYIYKHDKNPNAYRKNNRARLTALFELISKVG